MVFQEYRQAGYAGVTLQSRAVAKMQKIVQKTMKEVLFVFYHTIIMSIL